MKKEKKRKPRRREPRPPPQGPPGPRGPKHGADLVSPGNHFTIHSSHRSTTHKNNLVKNTNPEHDPEPALGRSWLGTREQETHHPPRRPSAIAKKQNTWKPAAHHKQHEFGHGPWPRILVLVFSSPIMCSSRPCAMCVVHMTTEKSKYLQIAKRSNEPPPPATPRAPSRRPPSSWCVVWWWVFKTSANSTRAETEDSEK